MDLNKFLQDLKMYQDLHKNDGYILTLDKVIEMVEEEIEEIRQDPVQGDVDDQERESYEEHETTLSEGDE